MGILGDTVGKIHTYCVKKKKTAVTRLICNLVYFWYVLWVSPLSLRSAGLSGCSATPSLSLFSQFQLQIRPEKQEKHKFVLKSLIKIMLHMKKQIEKEEMQNSNDPTMELYGAEVYDK